MYRFDDPAALVLLLVIPLGFWLRHRWGRASASIVYSRVEPARASSTGQGWLVRWVPPLLRGLALAAFVVALARPQTSIATENVLTEGIDIVLVLDVSSSMLAEDLEPNRIEAASWSPPTSWLVDATTASAWWPLPGKPSPRPR